MGQENVRPSIEGLFDFEQIDWVRWVRNFQFYKVPYADLPDEPTMLDDSACLEVVSSLLEEYEELVKALTLKDMAEAADGIVDMIYVLIGIGLRMGLPLKALFAEVHMSNMEKNPAAPGTRGRKAADGSSMKPPGWLPPRVKEILEHVKGEENA